MLKPLPTLALGALLAFPVAPALALGFGPVNNATVLGQALNFTVGVRLDGGETLTPDCVAAEVVAGENRLLSSIFLEPGGDAGERTLRVRSNAVVDEPVVSVNVQITCPPRVARKFVLFVDPPFVNLAQAEAPVQPAAPRVPAAPVAAAPIAAAAQPAAKPPASKSTVAKAASKPRPRVRRVLPADDVVKSSPTATLAADSAPSRAPQRNSPAVKSARAPANGGARLKLEASDDAATRERLDLRLTASLAPRPAEAASAAASAPVSAEEEAIRRARERIQAMEDALAKLGSESHATQASLAQLQLRLREAEEGRYANPLVYGLAALVVLLTGAVGVLLWRRGGERRAAAAWWAPSAAAGDAGPRSDWAAPDRRDLAQRRAAEASALAETTGSPMMLSNVQVLAHAADAAAREAATPREMSVEELIDLEQQAEFFVVLGQDDAAIDLLTSHLHSSGGASPLPYLKLLEIHRRRDERAAYERMRERFNRRFNAYAPDWNADLQQGRSLDGYPDVMTKLQTLWAVPEQSMAALETLLFRRDGGTPFDLPAYSELLFLYAVARDLSSHEVAAPPVSVDLLLPLGAEAAATTSSVTLLRPSSAVDVVTAPAPTVDLDITDLGAAISADDAPTSRWATDFDAPSGYASLSTDKPRAARR